MTAPLAHPASRAPLARRNPVAKVSAALIFTLALLVTVDPVTPAVALLIELVAVPFFGLRYATLAKRALPVLVGAVGVALTLVIFAAERTGAVLVELGPFDITTGVALDALSLSLRLLAVGLPGVLVVATTDPTDLADALVQNAHAPARFAIGALAAFRLVPLLGEEWRSLGRARRARGIEAGHNPLARLRLFTSTAFGLLVGAIRRGTRLAVAMDARGFDAGLPRTVARPSFFRTADAALIGAAALLAALALGTSIGLGTFRPLW